MKSFLEKKLIFLILSIPILLFITAIVVFSVRQKERRVDNQSVKQQITVTSIPTTKPNTKVILQIEPANSTLSLSDSQLFTLKATFTSGSREGKIDYFKTEIIFPKEYLIIPKGKYVDTSNSGFDKIFRVDSPVVANESGRITIELATTTPKGGPATDNPITIAKFYLSGKAITVSPQHITIGATQIVDSNSKAMEVKTQDTPFSVSSRGDL